MTMPAGWLCVADPDWLDYLSVEPSLEPLVYYKGPKRPTTQLSIGSPFFCCRTREWPLQVHLVARFDGFEILSVNDAWRRYGTRLGVASQPEWLRLNEFLLLKVRFSTLPSCGGRRFAAWPSLACQSGRGARFGSIKTVRAVPIGA